MELVRLDHTDEAQSEEICSVLLESYAVEARVIGVEDFTPLKRGSGAIRAAASTFYGCLSEGRLVGVAEIEEGEGGSAKIAGFVVHPGVFRQGIGSRLLEHLLTTVDATVFTVSTAAANVPAVAFYEKHGFRVRDRWVIEGIDMVTLHLSGGRPVCA